MYGRYIYAILFTALMGTATHGCRTDEPAPDSTDFRTDEPASLVITTDVSALISASGTRTVDADDNTIRHATLFLIDYAANRLVAYRNIYPNAPTVLQPYDDIDENNGFVDETTGEVDTSLTYGKAIKVTFEYNNPKHGLTEKLTQGNYMLLAVANYSESDQFGNSGISTRIASLLAEFEDNRDTGLDNFSQNYTDFYDMLLRIPTKNDSNGATYEPYVRPGNVSIPLSATHTINLISGVNRATAELKHTCARIRIDVRNYSDLTLKVNDLSMSDNFTQSACYLFSRTDTSDNYAAETEHYGKGAPVTTDSNALIPFVPETAITKDDGITTIFDGLIYESRDTQNNYTYTIDVEYEGGEDYVSYALKNGDTPITSLGDINTQGPYFLIRRRDTGSYLYVQDDKMYASTGNRTPQDVLDECSGDRYYDYVWELIPGGSGYYLRNVQTEDYVETVKSAYDSYETSRLKMVAQPEADTFNISLNGSYFLFRSNYYWNRYGSSAYINTRGTDNTLVVGWYDVGNWSQFALYPLTRQAGLRAKHEVVLQTIDKENSIVSDVHEIQRNDYVRVLIDVSYNPDKGDFEFFVNDWYTGGGDITFN